MTPNPEPTISKINFANKFHVLTGNPDPFPWQEELFRRFMANKVERSLDIPTGLGKTAVMAIWLLARAEGATIPRRLVYVVDRRAVVDQATDEANKLLKAVNDNQWLSESLRLHSHPLPLSTLRGQRVDNKKWLEDPSLPAIIVGTIDMIGSRLLFEGYGVSRKMRPYHAGLLGADTLVVLDEAHLVPPFEMLLDAISSNSARVAPRNKEVAAIVPQFKLMSLSATGRTRTEQPFSLTDNDLKHHIVRQRLDAKKRLRLKQLKAGDGLTTTELDKLLAQKLVRMAWIVAGRGTSAVRVIVFCNKRKVAEAAKKAIEQLANAAKQGDIKDRTELFVGGRRVYERERAAERLKKLGFIAGTKTPLNKPIFLFATSAGEVGVDLDADHMVSDLVEWERMVQRLGRVNRRGEGDAQVVVLVRPDHPKDKPPPPTPVEARVRPFDHLPRYEDGSINVSPGAIRDPIATLLADVSDPGLRLMLFIGTEAPSIKPLIAAATTPEPLRPALTRPVVDAWSMTSLKEHTGRPEIGPWLRGWIEDEPQTAVIWRTHLPRRFQGEVTKKEIEAFFEAAPPHTSEVLETETYQVIEWLAARVKSIRKAADNDQSVSNLRGNQPLAFVLSPAGDFRRTLNAEDLHFDSDDKRINQDRKERVRRAIAGGTLIVDANVAGLLEEGLLDSTEKKLPRTIDDGQEWLPLVDGEPVVRFRIRATESEAGGYRPTHPQWRYSHRFLTSNPDEDEPKSWLIVEKWQSDSTTEDDRAVGQCQLLEDHQRLAETLARKLAMRLNLPADYAEMLAIAARLHDEGKRAPSWQRAFNAPTDGVYAKTLGPIDFALLNGYRHEFKSLEVAAKDAELLKLPTKELQDLALHLITAHHGFGRPNIGISGCEESPPSRLAARAREVALRFARLQQRWGPWGLAWWESLLRAVDHQASRENDASDADNPKEAAP